MTKSDDAFAEEQEQQAAAEAGAIGGRVSSEEPTAAELEMDESERPVAEAGGGESEGFELSEAELEEHAAHGDEHAAGRIIEDADLLDEDETADPAVRGEGDTESPPESSR